MRITRLPEPGGGPGPLPQDLHGVPCSISFGIAYLFLCGKYDVNSGIAIPVFNVTAIAAAHPVLPMAQRL